jgi:hypothetical protein
MSSNRISRMSLLLLAMSISVVSMAEDPDPGPPPTGPGGGDPPTDPDAEIPFDGGLSLLLAAGTAYGAKRAADYRKFMKATKADGKA